MMTASTLLRRCGLLLGSIVVTLLLTPAAALAGDDVDPMQMVRTTTNELFSRVHEERDTLRRDPTALDPLIEQVLMPHVDLERTSRLVLGKHWRRASQPQRDEFMMEFKRMLLVTYSAAVFEFTDVSVDYLGTRFSDDGKESIVRTRVNMADGRPSVSIDYRVRAGDGDWKVFDVVVEGVSLVTTYRSSFNQEVSRVGIDGLLRVLRDRNRKQGGA